MKLFTGVVYTCLGIVSAIVLSQALLAWTNPTVLPGVGGGPISSLNGNVGIGTASPGGKLHINDGVMIIDKDYGIRGDGFNTGARNYIWALSSIYPDRGISYYEGTPDYISIHPGSTTSVLAVTDTGNVGIGTTGPNNKLTVNGGLNVTGAISGGTGLTLSDESTYKRIQSYETEPLSINPLGNNVGIGTTSPGELLSLGLAGTTKGVISLAGDTSGKIIIQPAATAGTYTLTLPTAQGAASTNLQNDGAGNLSWAAAASAPFAPTDVKKTTASHNGNFGSYAAMKTWIQTNGCADYHVCDSVELTRWAQAGGAYPNSCMYNTGVSASGTGNYNDCTNWTSVSTLDRAAVWSSAGVTNQTCYSGGYVCCCK